MDANRIAELEQILAAFPLTMLQDFRTFFKYCGKMNVKLVEVIEYIEIVRTSLIDDGDEPDAQARREPRRPLRAPWPASRRR